MSSATTPVLAPSGKTAARPAPADCATTKSQRERRRERERRARSARADVRCAAPFSCGRSARATATRRWSGREPHAASSCAPRACSANSSTSSSSGVRCDQASSRAISVQLVGPLDAELAGDALERLPLQRLVAVLVRVAQHGERALERRAWLDVERARAAGARRGTSGRRTTPRRAGRRRRVPIASQKSKPGDTRYVGEATGVKSKRQLRWFVLRRNAATPGLTCESTSTGGQLALMPYAGLPSSVRYSIARRVELEDVELVARRQARDARRRDAAQRPRPRHLREPPDAEAKDGRRPRRLVRARSRSSRGAASGRSTSCPRRSRASRSASSPNRCTVGVTVAYAFSGTPSPIDEPGREVRERGGRGRRERERGAGDERAAASCDGPAPHLAQVGPAQEGAEHARRSRACARRPARCRATGSRARARPSAPRARRGASPPLARVTYTGTTRPRLPGRRTGR